ncbi:unnamed protein product [Thlaspi arvense]|uniref:Uncharacterized protein n=1 Tax=Thlaspi arvense TaxID=13288 RepID=A0AAU9S356_THLAR|nr:unnamed protein product [Thlaspi arvense]
MEEEEKQASQAWMEWLMKKRKAFDQRGDMAVAAWAEQQQREMSLRARRLALLWMELQIDPKKKEDSGKRKEASLENFSNTLRRHTLVLKKRDIMRRKAEEERKKPLASF